MKTKAELEQDIIKISMRIHQDFPELSKYLNEMPISSSDKEGIDVSSLNEYYNSLVELIFEYSKAHDGVNINKEISMDKASDSLSDPPSEDIYIQGKLERDLNPENLSKNKSPNEKVGLHNEKGFIDDMSGDDLDVPGAELDDQQERIGNEDEENNYYSLGGENHHDLDEN